MFESSWCGRMMRYPMTAGGSLCYVVRMMPRTLMLFGPTAVGKTALSIALAQTLNGEIINADSRQIYRGLPVLTAVPDMAERQGIPHHLFEFLDPATAYDVGRYLADVTQCVAQLHARGKTAIIVGGTGFYLDVLLQGISPMPNVPDAFLETLQAELATRGHAALHHMLATVDPAWAAAIPPTDTQRLLRGLSVYRATGRPLSAWQQQPKIGALAGPILTMGLYRSRAELRARIQQRVTLMWQQGVVAEVQTQLLHLPPDAPGLTSLGAQPILQYLRGELPLTQAQAQFALRDGQYAKRQLTWLKGHFSAQVCWRMPVSAVEVTAWIFAQKPQPVHK